MVEDVKRPRKVSFKSLAESSKNPAASSELGELQPIDMNYFGMQRPEQLHLAICGVHQFKNEMSRYPLDNEEDIAKVLQMVREINSRNRQQQLLCVEELDEEICRNVAAYSTCSVTTQAAMFGGLVAQEIVKITGKYTPLRQWIHYDCFESLPAGEVDRSPTNSRYDD